MALSHLDILKNKVFLFFNDLKKSGIILFDAKSPPPITFPALTVTHEIFCFESMSHNMIE